MRTRLLNVALLGALALAVFRLWLFLGEPPPSLPAIESGGAQTAESATEREQKVETGGFPPEAYEVVVARDLFSPARGVAPSQPTIAIKPALKPQPPPKLTLFGVVIMEGEKTAYLQEGTQEGRPKKVRENESFANGVVKSIRPDGITFLFAGTEFNVPLRTPKDATGAPSPGRPDSAGAPSRPQPPAASPRRQMPPGTQQGTMPLPGRPELTSPGMPMGAPSASSPGMPVGAPSASSPGMPMGVPPVDPGGDNVDVEPFPESGMPGDEVPGMEVEPRE